MPSFKVYNRIMRRTQNTSFGYESQDKIGKYTMQHTAPSKDMEIPKLAYSVKEAAVATTLSIPYLRKKIRDKSLRTRRVGSRTLIMTEDLLDFLNHD